MQDSLSIDDIDQLLNELEQLAHSRSTRRDFFGAALDRLKYLLNPVGSAVVMRAGEDQWLPAAVAGPISLPLVDRLLTGATESEVYRCTDDSRCLAVPIRRSQWQRGAVIVQFGEPLSEAQLDELVKLCQAFAEVIAIRQWSELEVLLDEKLPAFQLSLNNLSNASSVGEGAYGIVNDLAVLLQADRVSLVKAGSRSGARALAVSGVIRAEQKAQAVAAIEQVCEQAIGKQQPVSRHKMKGAEEASGDSGERSSDTDLLENYACIPLLLRQRSRSAVCNSALLLEWDEYDPFVVGCSTLAYVFPTFAAGWQQLERWLRIPQSVRWLCTLGAGNPVSSVFAKSVRWAILVAVAVVVLWALNRPVALRIEAEGTLQPVEKRSVFAAMDGVVSKILVTDGQQVRAGDPLVQMQSPSLEIQLQEVLGEMRANSEKRDGLNVAINQHNSNSSDYVLQSKLSSEIRELETREGVLQAKHRALMEEQRKLTIAAPIDGIVVARQIERFLTSRPVRRGDSLLRVIRLDGPWQIELLVADADSGYVKEKLYGAGFSNDGQLASGRDGQLQFVLASQPDVELTAQVSWMSESARNATGAGVYVDLFADVPQEVATQGHMGATVYAYVDCGREPFWFVWSRPLVEAIQRKLWF